MWRPAPKLENGNQGSRLSKESSKIKLDDRSISDYIAAMSKKTEQTRTHILNVGRELMSEQGFNALGLGQLLKVADVPKGSFYHYFSSKEDFGCKLLEQYIETYHSRLDVLWAKEGRNGREKLMEYWQQWIVTQSPATCTGQCLIVKLGAEVSDMSEAMRSILAEGASSIIERLARQIKLGIDDGSLDAEINPEKTAAMLYQMWLGASLLAKLDHSETAFQLAYANSEAMLPKANH